MQTVLVAGGAGFIGSSLCKSLLLDGYKVFCLDNLITGDKTNIKELLSNSNFEFLEQDITKIISNSQFSTLNFQFIFHLASPASPNKKSKKSYISYPIETMLANSLGAYNLLEIAKKSSAKFLYASSSEIYGDPKVFPQNENYWGNVNPNGVRSVYDEAKRFGEALTMAYFRKYKINTRIVRIFNTYGPNMQADDGRVVSNFVNQAIGNMDITVYGNGSQTRSFCYIDDMIDGLKRSIFSDKTEGDVFNLGNPDERAILDMAELIKQMTGSVSKIVLEDLPEDDPKSRKPDISKAKKILNWEPKIPIEIGLQKTIEYFKSLLI